MSDSSFIAFPGQEKKHFSRFYIVHSEIFRHFSIIGVLSCGASKNTGVRRSHRLFLTKKHKKSRYRPAVFVFHRQRSCSQTLLKLPHSLQAHGLPSSPHSSSSGAVHPSKNSLIAHSLQVHGYRPANSRHLYPSSSSVRPFRKGFALCKCMGYRPAIVVIFYPEQVRIQVLSPFQSVFCGDGVEDLLKLFIRCETGWVLVICHNLALRSPTGWSILHSIS